MIDAPIISSGYLAPYFTDEDIKNLIIFINPSSPLSEGSILLGVHRQYTPAIGAALFYIEQFIQTI